jgi:glycosyltransferase involved in cell wall biosynthesis
MRLPRRILMTADAVGGVWTYALDLAAALSCMGVRTMLAVTGPLAEQERRRADAVPGLTLESAPFKLEWMAEAEADLQRTETWLMGLAAGYRPDLVHLNSYSAALVPWGVPSVLVAHSCLATWWQAVHGTRPGPEWEAYIERVRRALRSADAVVAPSAAMRSDMAQAYGEGLGDVRVIHNGRDPRLFAPMAKEPFALCAGRLWDRGKGIDTLDAAAAGLEWTVHAAGPLEGPDGSAARFDHLNCLGALPEVEVARWIARCAVFCAPSRYEPFGLTALEAAMSGSALLLSDIPTFRELWDGAAAFVPAGDAGALHAELADLARDADRRAGLAEAARLRAENYSVAEAARRYARLYGELLARDAQPSLARAAG